MDCIDALPTPAPQEELPEEDMDARGGGAAHDDRRVARDDDVRRCCPSHAAPAAPLPVVVLAVLHAPLGGQLPAPSIRLPPPACARAFMVRHGL
jgi:hypothetical protein